MMDKQSDSEIPASKSREPTLSSVPAADSVLPCDVGGGDIDVVFVHGLMGSAHGTWITEDEGKKFVWPTELQSDLNENVCPARVWALDYNAPVRQKDPPGLLRRAVGYFSKNAEEAIRGEHTDIPLSLKQRAEFLCQGVLQGDDRLGDRPIVFVTHSLGGLIVKAMLEREWIARGSKSSILQNTKAVVFLGTPHSGSALADLAVTLSAPMKAGGGMLGAALATALGGPTAGLAGGVGGKAVANWILGPSATVESLKQDNPELFDLMQSYRSIAKERSIETLSCYETRNFKVAIVVSRSSADPGIGDFLAIEDADHSTICKPKSENSPVYRIVRQVIVRAATRAQKATQRPVFDQAALRIVRVLRASRFPMLPKFAWEEANPMTSDSLRRLEDLAPDLPKPKGANWTEKDGKNFRRRVAVEFFRLCEVGLRDGTLEISNADVDAAEHSQFDIDKLVLIAWRKHCLEKAIRDTRNIIEEQCGYVRGTYDPTLTILYRAIDSLDKALIDQLTLALGTELRLVRDAIAARAKDEELDGDGITRARIDDLVAKIRAIAELTLASRQP